MSRDRAPLTVRFGENVLVCLAGRTAKRLEALVRDPRTPRSVIATIGAQPSIAPSPKSAGGARPLTRYASRVPSGTSNAVLANVRAVTNRDTAAVAGEKNGWRLCTQTGRRSAPRGSTDCQPFCRPTGKELVVGRDLNPRPLGYESRLTSLPGTARPRASRFYWGF